MTDNSRGDRKRLHSVTVAKFSQSFIGGATKVTSFERPLGHIDISVAAKGSSRPRRRNILQAFMAVVRLVEQSPACFKIKGSNLATTGTGR